MDNEAAFFVHGCSDAIGRKQVHSANLEGGNVAARYAPYSEHSFSAALRTNLQDIACPRKSYDVDFIILARQTATPLNPGLAYQARQGGRGSGPIRASSCRHNFGQR